MLHGSGSTFYGSDAIGGAVNLITQRPPGGYTLQPYCEVRRGKLWFARKSSSRRTGALAASARSWLGAVIRRMASSSNRNYSSNALSSETWLNLLKPGTTDVLLATSDRPYGANQFYGNYNSWERTKGWFAAIQQQLGTKTSASFAYRRHTDLFVLLLERPNYYRNNHITTAWQGAFRRADALERTQLSPTGLKLTAMGFTARTSASMREIKALDM